MDIQFITKEDFITNIWSGGETKQLLIYPSYATLSKRDFIYRVSSANFTSTSSQFSDFSSYNRYLLSLEGSLYVSHKGLYSRKLENYDVEYFSGNWKTYCENSLDCVDFNVIVKEGIQSRVDVFKEKDIFIPKRNGTLLFYCKEDFDICIYEEKCNKLSVKKDTLAIIKEKDILHKIVVEKSNKPVIICEIII